MDLKRTGETFSITFEGAEVEVFGEAYLEKDLREWASRGGDDDGTNRERNWADFAVTYAQAAVGAKHSVRASITPPRSVQEVADELDTFSSNTNDEIEKMMGSDALPFHKSAPRRRERLGREAARLSTEIREAWEKILEAEAEKFSQELEAQQTVDMLASDEALKKTASEISSIEAVEPKRTVFPRDSEQD